MKDDAPTGNRPTFLAHLSSWLGGWRFPAVAITLLGSFTAFVLLAVLVPAAPTGFGAFADAFRTWCFDWQGGNDAPIAAVAFMLSELVLFIAIVAWLWSRPLGQALRTERQALLGVVAGALVASSGAIAALMVLGTPGDSQALDPAALRMDRPAPPLVLVDQDGATVDLADFRGRVVVVTAVYSTCGDTCPMLLGKARKALAGLTEAERRELHMFAVTLDPVHDTPEHLARVAFNIDAHKPLWYLLSGAPAVVEATLDRYDVSRQRNVETGRIDHANVFVVIDRAGHMAFRFGLGGDERLMSDALRLLLREPRPAPGKVP